MKFIKLLLMSAILISVKSVAEMKLYQIVVGIDYEPYTVKFLLDDEIAPDYTNNVNLNMWSTASNVITISPDGSMFNSGNMWVLKEQTGGGDCYWQSFGLQFGIEDGFIARVRIPGCHPGLGFGPENTFSLTENTFSLTELTAGVGALMNVSGCGRWGCADSYDNDVFIFSISITPFEGSDSDGDLISSTNDNCPNAFNLDQLDSDGDGLGNACDSMPNGDDDNDGVDNSSDNCINVENSDQANLDGDSHGDVCDLDVDGDLILDSVEVVAGTDPNDHDDGPQAITEALGVNKNVPAMGGIGLLALGLSMLGLGAVRMRKK